MRTRFPIALAGIALAPFALTFFTFLTSCTKPAETSAIDAAISADPAARESASSAASSVGIAPPPSPPLLVASASAPSSASSASSKRQACEALRAKLGAVIAGGRGCKADADCDYVYTGCGLEGMCGAPIAKSHAPQATAVSQDFFARDCPSALPPMPCATCPMPPPVRCTNGQCN